MRFVRFWWDFVVGDDWVAAAGVAFALGATALFGVWWLMPIAVALVLLTTILRSLTSGS